MTLQHCGELPRIIGLTGYAQHGKDTVGKILTGLYGYTRYAFADQVRELALRVDPWVPNPPAGFLDPLAALGLHQAANLRLSRIVELVGWEEAKAKPEVRRILVELGMGVRDVVGSDSWVYAGANQMDKDTSRYGGAVFTDVRFPNEVKWVKDNGGVVIRIIRPGVEAVPHDNAAEVHVPNLSANFDIVNDGSIDDLHRVVRGVMTDLREGFRGSML